MKNLMIVSIVDDTNAVPVLVRCQHGADRTGTMCAMYRILRHVAADM